MYYFRDDKGREIDLLIQINGHYQPIEIKMTDKPTIHDMENFPYFCQYDKLGPGAVICMTPEVKEIALNVTAMSVWDM